jgi:hypothetical protein
MKRTLVVSCALAGCIAVSAFATTAKTSRHVVFYVGPCVDMDARTDQLERTLGFRSVSRYSGTLLGFAADLTPEQRVALEAHAGIHSVHREPVDVVVFLRRPAHRRAQAIEQAFGFRWRLGSGPRAGLAARLAAAQIGALDTDPGVVHVTSERWIYIVRLKLPAGDVAAIDAKIDELEQRLGFRALARYHHALAGFAANLSSWQLSSFERDLLIASVEPSSCWRIPFPERQGDTPRLLVGGVALTPRRPTADRTFAIRLKLLRSGRPPRPARLDGPRVRCSGRLQGKLLRSAVVVRGTAVTCSWRVPRRASGKRLLSSIEARDLTTPGDPGVRKTFSARVR